ncbi:MAG: hypothetical protein Q3994_05785 [Prevotella sp.]|nr:hypothetical protein [Prevotella sp.]
MNKRIYVLFISFYVLTVYVSAQSGTNSPYSMYGLGILSERSQGFNRGMAGISQGFREGTYVNPQNPASYSNVDSLTFIFDAAVALQNMNISENGVKNNAKNGNFEYVVASFRVLKNLGASFGIMPFTNVGYDFSRTGTTQNKDIYSTTYTGSGGLHQAYIGFGWRPFKPFSVGFNIGYLWGSQTKVVATSYSSGATPLNRYYTSDVNSYTLDLGMQYSFRVGKDDNIVLGATYSLGHELGNTAYMYDILNDSTQYSVKDAFSMPHIVSGGVAWHRPDKWSFGIDYTFYKFGSLAYPDVINTSANRIDYQKRDGLLMDRSKIAVGGERIPGKYSRNFFERIHYRAGAYFATPYVKVYDASGKLIDGPKEYGVSVGLGIPIMNTYNNRSLLNVSGQWVYSGMSNLIKENYLRLTIGLTFNEKWFAKWKFE